MRHSAPIEKEKSPQELASALLDEVKALITEVRPEQSARLRVELDSTLDREIGLDSLSRVELIGRIERSFEVTLPERVFTEAETPRDLLRAVLSADPSKSTTQVVDSAKMELPETEGEPHQAETLIEVLNWHAYAHPNRPQIRFYSEAEEGEVITYGQLRERAASVASGLQNLGVEPGEPVALILPTGQDYFFSFFGILLAGGVPVPMYPPVRWKGAGDHLLRHRAIMSNCAASTLITVPEARKFAGLLKTQVDTLDNIVTVADLESADVDFQEPAVKSNAVAFLQYTSGSTGNPKGVVLTHANLLSNIRAMGNAIEADSSDVFVSWLPLYHDMGLIGAWLGSLYYAMVLVIMPPTSFLARPKRWFEAIHRYRGTLSAAPNFAYELCLKRLADNELEGLDLSTWRVAFNGAEPVNPDTVERFCKRFDKFGFKRKTFSPVFGLAECSVGLAFPPLERDPIVDRIQRDSLVKGGQAIPADDSDALPHRFVSCGRPIPGHEIRVVDEAGRELPERREGKVQFRGPSATSGYYRSFEETRRLFDEDWLNTGDLGYFAGGDLFVTGRTSDIIIRAGRNIYPQELEEAIGRISGVIEGHVAVFGSSDSASGSEKLVVLAEARSKNPEVLDEIRAAINALSTDLVGTPPDDCVLAPPRTVLKTSSGKIRRSASRELYERGAIGQHEGATWKQVARLTWAGFLPQVRRTCRNTSAAIYAACCWTVFVTMAPFVWLAVVTLPYSSWRWSFIRMTGRLLARITRIPLIVNDAEHTSLARPCVIVSNHASYLDGYVLAATLPVNVRFVAKAELKENIFIRLFLNRLGAEYVERFDSLQGIEDAGRIGGESIVNRPLLYFAEGTFTRMPGLLPFHMGGFLAAAKTGADVIPLAIRGTRSILRADSWFPRWGAITVTIGTPLATKNSRDQTASELWADAVRLRDAARDHILRHCGEPDLAHERAPIFEAAKHPRNSSS